MIPPSLLQYCYHVALNCGREENTIMVLWRSAALVWRFLKVSGIRRSFPNQRQSVSFPRVSESPGRIEALGFGQLTCCPHSQSHWSPLMTTFYRVGNTDGEMGITPGPISALKALNRDAGQTLLFLRQGGDQCTGTVRRLQACLRKSHLFVIPSRNLCDYGARVTLSWDKRNLPTRSTDVQRGSYRLGSQSNPSQLHHQQQQMESEFHFSEPQGGLAFFLQTPQRRSLLPISAGCWSQLEK